MEMRSQITGIYRLLYYSEKRLSNFRKSIKDLERFIEFIQKRKEDEDDLDLPKLPKEDTRG